MAIDPLIGESLLAKSAPSHADNTTVTGSQDN